MHLQQGKKKSTSYTETHNGPTACDDFLVGYIPP
jgi:hypothetical protein